MAKIPRKKIADFIETEEGKKWWAEFQKGNKVETPSETQTSIPGGEGVLPSVEAPKVETGNQGPTEGPKEPPKQEVPPVNPEVVAKSFSAFVTLIANFNLHRQGRELVTDIEMETYAREITPFVTKYQAYLRHMVELQMVAATGMFVWAMKQKPVVDVEKHNEYLRKTGKAGTNGESKGS